MILEDTYIDEWIGFGEDNEWLPEIKYTQNPEYYTDMYEAWQTKAPLIIGQEVEWTVWGGWWQVKTWYVSVPSGYTDFAITWVWFTPKVIQVTVHSWNKSAWGYADNVWWTLAQRCIFQNAGSWDNSNIRLFRFSSTEVWLLVSIDSDWFTVKSDLACTMIYTCFW